MKKGGAGRKVLRGGAAGGDPMVSSPVVVFRYVRYDASGRSYKRMFLKDAPCKELGPQLVIDPVSGQQVWMLVPSQVGSAGQRPDKHRAVPIKAVSTRGLHLVEDKRFQSHQHS